MRREVSVRKRRVIIMKLLRELGIIVTIEDVTATKWYYLLETAQYRVGYELAK
jgi:hypothetical protein